MNSRTSLPKGQKKLRYGFIDNLSRIELLHAKLGDHAFGIRSHDTWSIGAVISGAKDTAPKNFSPNVVSSGELYVIPPDEAHAGKTVGDHGCEYVMIYVPKKEWEAQCSAHGISLDRFSAVARKNQRLVAHIHSFVTYALQHPERLLELENQWHRLAKNLLAQYGNGRADAINSSLLKQDRNINLARDYVNEYWKQSISLEVLAEQASMSTYALCRRFTSAYGLSPHRYQLVLRVLKAKDRLLEGMRISDVAIDTGFSDQSHLGRHFMSLLGITPGAVSRAAGRARTF